MSFIIVGLMDNIADMMDYTRIANYAKVGCVFRDLTKKKKDKVKLGKLTNCQTDKITPKV